MTKELVIEAPQQATVPRLFTAQAAQRPHAVAVHYGLDSLSYGELQYRSYLLAHRLRRLGVSLESRVGVFLEPSCDMVVVLLAILRAGGVYVPLDPSYPPERLTFMLADSAPVVVISQQSLLDELPTSAAEVVIYDRSAKEEQLCRKDCHETLCSNQRAENLAYIIYTSGSTGRPKGVSIPHRGIVRLVRRTNYIPPGSTDRVAQVANSSFDAVTFEIWAPLLNGGCIQGIAPAIALEPSLFALELRRSRVTSMFLTSALFNQVARQHPDAFARMECLMVGGEALHPGWIRHVLEHNPPRYLLNGYGPTENTTFSATFAIERVPAGSSGIPIGAAIAHSTTHIVDSALLPVATGAVGELLVGGEGLARGYQGRPRITALAFVPDPFASDAGGRLYRTGDLAQQREGGALEFLGRVDHQVKLRGFRIELGEIEAVLDSHPQVAASTAMLQSNSDEAQGSEEQWLVAYVVPQEEPEGAASQGRSSGGEEQVSQWQMIFEDLYGEEDHREEDHGEDDGITVHDPTFDVTGWLSTYTEEPIPEPEMREWLADTISMIESLNPRRVLEIGCGTGMLLFRIAPISEFYFATDISQRVLQGVEAELRRRGDLPQVQLAVQPAEEFGGLEPDCFDTVLLNSVVQYFPSADYLATVLRKAARVVRPGGSIFVGDVRNLPLLDALHSSVELFQAADEISVEELRENIEGRRQRENELVLDPAFFTALQEQIPEIGRVEIVPKRGRAMNELTAFRYQVVLHVGAPKPSVPSLPWLDWNSAGMSLASLRQRLEESVPSWLGLSLVPNVRVVREAKAVDLLTKSSGDSTVGEMRQALLGAGEGAVDPQDFWDLGEELAYDVAVGLMNDEEGSLAVVFRPRETPDASSNHHARSRRAHAALRAPEPRRGDGFVSDDGEFDLSRFANNPAQGAVEQPRSGALRAFLANKLPQYMVPSFFVFVPEIPLTPNGKVDRGALQRLAPTSSQGEISDTDIPRTPLEDLLATLWAQVLGLDRVGIHDDFFTMGGHSLKATQVVSRLRETSEIKVTIRQVMEASTVAELAGVVQDMARQEDGRDEIPPLVPRHAGGNAVPASFAQRRLWFLHRWLPGNLAYNVPLVLYLRGPLVIAALEGALEEISRRHGALRTTFHEAEDGPVQVEAQPSRGTLPCVDLSTLGSRALQVAEELYTRVGLEPYELSTGPLWRRMFVRLGDEKAVLLVAFHHIVFDGWSMGLFYRELASLYDAAKNGKPSPLVDPIVQPVDFALWQHSWLKEELLEGELAWWKERLAGSPTVLDLPTDRPRQALREMQFPGASYRFVLPPTLGFALEEVGRQRGATLFMVFLATFQVLLARLTGQRDFLVGFPVANRTRREIENLIGFFVNTLALRARLEGASTFGDLLHRARQETLASSAHQDLPFETLVQALEEERTPGIAPLVQVMIVLQTASMEVVQPTGLHLEARLLPTGAARFDLGLELTVGDQGVRGETEYNRDLFDATTVERFMGAFRLLLDAVVQDPDRPLAELSLLSAAQRHQLVTEWNESAVLAPHLETVPWLFEEQAKKVPEAIAVLAGESRLSFGELSRRSQLLAAHLVEEGVAPEVVVGLCLGRTPELVLAMLAVFKAGGAFVALDPALPVERLDFLVEDAQVAVVIHRGGGGPRAFRTRTIDLDEFGRRPSPHGAELSTGPAPQDLAYLIFTSGTTGRPKAVLVEHRQLSHTLWASRRMFGSRPEALAWRPGDVQPVVAPFSFDIFFFELLNPLLAGATAHFVPVQPTVDLGNLCAALERAAVFHAVPSLMRAVMEHVDALGLFGFPGLRTVFVGGEAVSSDVFRELRRIFPNAEIRILYGPTEATIVCSSHKVGEGGDEGFYRPLLGRPLDGVDFRVCDADGRMVPLGVPGELWIGGPGLSRGYCQRPTLEAERFPVVNGRRFYRSGDRVRSTATGEFEFLGRDDRQVKVRGFRIELGEIEAVLLGHPDVRQAAVVEEAERLVAFVVPGSPQAKLDLVSVEGFLRQRLPVYMVPAEIIERSQLPLLATGKLDRRLLRREASEFRTGGAHRVAPRTPMEELLSEMWCELLDLPRVGVKDSFFRLGGHSLLATRWVSRLRSAYGMEVSLNDLFENPTIESLAQRMERSQHSAAQFETPPLLARQREAEAVPASFAQERLWFLDQWQPESAVYNVPVVLRLDGPLDCFALARSLAEIERRHEVLRTVFEAREDGPPVQRIVSPSTFQLPLVDFSDLPTADQEAQRLVEEATNRPFDLVCGPLWWAFLLRVHATEHRLFLGLHHIIFDGASMAVLMHELKTLYEAWGPGLPSPLPDLAVQYGDFSRWQRSWLQGERLEAELAFWRERLAEAPTLLELPADRPRPAEQGDGGSNLPVTFPAPLVARLEHLGRNRGATLFMVLLAGFTTLMARLSGQRDLVLAMPIANRTQRELETLLGFFVNTLALRFQWTGRPSFERLLTQAREVALAAYQHQDLPFEKIIEDLRPDRTLNHTPFLQVVLGLEPGTASSEQLGEVTVSREFVQRSASKGDLSLVLEKTTSGLSGEVEYSTELFDATTIRRWLRHLETLLQSALADPGREIDGLSWLDPAQRSQLVVEWNDTARRRAPWVAVHELFARQAARRPDAIAVEQGSSQLSFRELKRRVGGLATLLKARGLREEAKVGLAIRRSPEWVVAMLAVLEAGGAYIPLDPDHPEERRASLLRESRAAWLLTADGAEKADAGGEVVGAGEGIPRIDLLSEGALTVPGNDSALGDGFSPPSPERLAYVLYTSGSSGRPKGVMMSHGALSNFLMWMMESFEFAPGDSYLGCTPAVFDPSVKEYYLPLISGGRITLVESGGQADFPYLTKLSVERRIRHQQLVPTQAHLFLEEPGLKHYPLKQFFCGGEALSTELADRLAASPLGDVDLYNFYGPTETCVLVTWARFRGAVHRDPWSSLAIGRPIGNTQAYVLDSNFRPSPLGVPGELVIAGGNLARGYLGAPRQTAEAFLPDPFTSQPGARLYRTGDLVHSLQDGRLIFQQRKDFQIKLHGLRIEPAEIETVLLGHPAVRSAVVTSQEQRLVAWLTPAGEGLSEAVEEFTEAVEGLPEASEMREFLAESLPAHLVPTHFLWLPSLPETTSGKADRAELQSRALPALDEEPSGEGPRTPTEEILQSIWSEVLKRDGVGRTQSFFDLGGHSLLATQVTSRASTLFGVTLGPRQLFEHPTVATLAAEVDRLRVDGRGGVEALEPIRPVSRQQPLQLSFAQERLWFLNQLNPNDLTYNSTFPLELEGSLDVEALRSAFEQLVERHEILRTTFVRGGDQPVQRIAAAGSHPLPMVDLLNLEEAARRSQLERWTFEEEQRPYDLAKGPLFRTLLFRLAADRHALLMSWHHIVFDGWSLGILMEEAIELYEHYAQAVVGDRHVRILPSRGKLRALPVQYADYALWQRQKLHGEALGEQLAWWREALASNGSPARLPVDTPRTEAGPSRSRRQNFRVSAATSDGLRALARQENATLFITLLATFKTLLHRTAGADSVSLGTPIANRHHLEIEGLIGFFVNTLVIRTDFGGRPSFRTVLARVRDASLGAYDHQDLPYEKLVADLVARQQGSGQSLFQALFTLGDPQPQPRQVPGLLFRPLPPAAQGRRGTAFELSLGMADPGEPGSFLVGSLEYDGALFEAATIDSLLQRFQKLLDQIVDDPDRAVADLEIFAPGEEQKLHAAAANALAIEAKASRSTPVEKEGDDEEQQADEGLRAKVSARKKGLSDAKRALLARRLKGRKRG